MHIDPAAIATYLEHVIGAPVQIEHIGSLGGGTSGAAALKAFGYGRPVCIDVRPVQPFTADSAPPEGSFCGRLAATVLAESGVPTGSPKSGWIGRPSIPSPSMSRRGILSR